jgi:hypothetical protein
MMQSISYSASLIAVARDQPQWHVNRKSRWVKWAHQAFAVCRIADHHHRDVSIDMA